MSKRVNLPKQDRPSAPRMSPGGHSHLKLPAELMQMPFWQGFWWHSSISISMILYIFFTCHCVIIKLLIPMQVFPSEESLYPESQTHLNEPSILIHLPLSHMPVCPHSSMSTQNGPTAELENPSSQTHSNEPGIFSHRPLRQMRGFSAHSSKSARSDLFMSYLCPVIV